MKVSAHVRTGTDDDLDHVDDGLRRGLADSGLRLSPQIPRG